MRSVEPSDAARTTDSWIIAVGPDAAWANLVHSAAAPRMRPFIPGRGYTQHPSGLYVPPPPVRPASARASRSRDRPIGVDLFCGAGGFSLGFIQAGFAVVAACDNDAAATLTYLVNLGAYPVEIHYATPEDRERLEREATRCLVEPLVKREAGAMVAGGGGGAWALGARGTSSHAGGGPLRMRTAGSGWIAAHSELPGVAHFFFGDIRRFGGRQILGALGLEQGEIDCVFGGPPCQGFSYAGQRNVMDPRNSLVFEFARLVLELWPRTFVMENVPGIATMQTPEGVPVLDALAHLVADGGWASYEAIRRMLVGHPARRAVLRQASATSAAQDGTDARGMRGATTRGATRIRRGWRSGEEEGGGRDSARQRSARRRGTDGRRSKQTVLRGRGGRHDHIAQLPLF